jgi:hypothetical protein
VPIGQGTPYGESLINWEQKTEKTRSLNAPGSRKKIGGVQDQKRFKPKSNLAQLASSNGHQLTSPKQREAV